MFLSLKFNFFKIKFLIQVMGNLRKRERDMTTQKVLPKETIARLFDD